MKKTPLYDIHVKSGAKIVEFGGWDMPIQYETGIVREHLQTRRAAGLFDVSHMGRFIISGDDALMFLQYNLTNNAAALEVGESQYTIIPNETGGAIDDAYLYRFKEDEFLLVVNASNTDKDWSYLSSQAKTFGDVLLSNRTAELAMISLQGPTAKEVLSCLIAQDDLPRPMRNQLNVVQVAGQEVWVARTGYTGEPICFELFVPADMAAEVWNKFITAGATPVGLGARDTLRLEAGLPLYGHEFGEDPEGKEIPIFACPLAKFAASFSELKGDFVGCEPLTRQFAALQRVQFRDFSDLADLPRRIQPLALTGKGITRAGDKVFIGDKHVGYVTSGTMVPYWKEKGEGVLSTLSEEHPQRPVALALLDNNLLEGDEVEVEVRGRKIPGLIVPYHLRSEAPPLARAILPEELYPEKTIVGAGENLLGKAVDMLRKSLDNHIWRRQQCINLIPSEQTPSRLVRWASILDPVGRYAEHKAIKALKEAEVFFYQGTDFIYEVESRLEEQLRLYFGCSRIEARVISGQMANMTVFSAMNDFINRTNRKCEPRRMNCVMNHHIINGGHLSAQPMGALRDFVRRDPTTERPAAVNFPVLKDNPYRIDVDACEELFERFRPELVILGKSMILHREPVAEMRDLMDKYCPDSVLMYDMAHVLGLIGPAYQEPFKEGADVVTGSTHKTFFGPQRGVIAMNCRREDIKFPLFEAMQRRTFPGSVSNHHLGTVLGLLFAAYEMNQFKSVYQKAVVANAKAFAKALKDRGLDVAGDPAISFTETHQVILRVGYAHGPEIARRLEDNNIVVNYQACPEDEGFTASAAIRLGVAEMTRFGMKAGDFTTLADYMYEIIVNNKTVKDDVAKFRSRFTTMQYCFDDKQTESLLQEIHKLL
ncbi:MAG: glycine cleavage system aminomethyltransferase GcvT [Sedimentisphaerales bacterium]|nr:glycine cleavage system aminomethyltransferase GcvT [Sedimentisphaerales bacterium]